MKTAFYTKTALRLFTRKRPFLNDKIKDSKEVDTHSRKPPTSRIKNFRQKFLFFLSLQGSCSASFLKQDCTFGRKFSVFPTDARPETKKLSAARPNTDPKLRSGPKIRTFLKFPNHFLWIFSGVTIFKCYLLPKIMDPENSNPTFTEPKFIVNFVFGVICREK